MEVCVVLVRLLLPVSLALSVATDDDGAPKGDDDHDEVVNNSYWTAESPRKELVRLPPSLNVGVLAADDDASMVAL